jgi:hypothetical protein
MRNKLYIFSKVRYLGNDRAFPSSVEPVMEGFAPSKPQLLLHKAIFIRR